MNPANGTASSSDGGRVFRPGDAVGEMGDLGNPDDLAALKERILFLVDNDQVRAQFSQHAREDIMSDASIEGMFSGFKQCVEYLTGLGEIRTSASVA